MKGKNEKKNLPHKVINNKFFIVQLRSSLILLYNVKCYYTFDKKKSNSSMYRDKFRLQN